MPDQHPLNSSVAEQLAEFSVGTTIDDIPEDVIAMAKVGILDCLGVTLAGSAKAASRKIQSYVRDTGGHPKSTVIGVALKTSAPSAALANGYAAHVLDFDDTQRSMISHPTATVLPAVLALGELLNVSGGKLLEAYLVGTEIACKIGRGVNPEHAKHWHGSGTLGTMGAAAGAMKIFDLADISQIIFKSNPMMHGSHRRGKEFLSAAIRRPDFGDWAVFGSPFRKFSRHPDTPIPSFLTHRVFPRPTPERVFVANHQSGPRFSETSSSAPRPRPIGT